MFVDAMERQQWGSRSGRDLGMDVYIISSVCDPSIDEFE